MSSDKEQEAFAIIDPSDSYAMKARRNRSNSGCCKSCMKGLILFIALVLAILCAVAIVLVIMLYVRPIIETDFEMQKARIYELEMLLNQTIRRADAAEEMRMQLNESQAAAVVEISMLSDSLDSAMAEIVDLQASTGTVYINYGSNTCPSIDGTELVYNGYMAGNDFGSQGGGSNFLCAPMDPDNTGISTVAGERAASLLSGIEYEDPIFNRVNEQAACAVCSVSGRSRLYMQPGKTSCPDGTWTREYLGYLATEGVGNRRTDFVCINAQVDIVPGLGGHQQSGDLWVVEPRCGNSLMCPPYTMGEELGCAVCTK